MPRIEEVEKKRNKRIITIIVLCILAIALIVGVIFLILYLKDKANELPPSNSGDDTTPTEVIEDKSNEYNRLLQLVNDEASKNSYSLATEVISFNESSGYFSITACNESKVYNYSIDISSLMGDDSLDYFLIHDPTSSMTRILDSYNKSDIPSEFTSKYLNGDNIKAHSTCYVSGAKTYITSTIYDTSSKKVNVIYKVDKDTVLDNSYIPIEIDKAEESLYSMYRYIATR